MFFARKMDGRFKSGPLCVAKVVGGSSCGASNLRNSRFILQTADQIRSDSVGSQSTIPLQNLVFDHGVIQELQEHQEHHPSEHRQPVEVAVEAVVFLHDVPRGLRSAPRD